METAAGPSSIRRTTCCAWCGRVRLARGWVDRPAHPELEPDDANYGICPRCAARVRAVCLSQGA